MSYEGVFFIQYGSVAKVKDVSIESRCMLNSHLGKSLNHKVKFKNSSSSCPNLYLVSGSVNFLTQIHVSKFKALFYFIRVHA